MNSNIEKAFRKSVIAVGKYSLKKAFTIVEVSILFVIFLIVAFLVAPLSLDDTLQVKYASRWKDVQSDFENIYYSVYTQTDNDNFDFQEAFETAINNSTKGNLEYYKIKYLNGSFPIGDYKFDDLKQTYSNAVVAYKFFDKPKNGLIGILMYDVNGQQQPNIWGKDIFGLNIYKDRLEPCGKEQSIEKQKKDCSRSGTGICCSNYFLIGGKLQ